MLSENAVLGLNGLAETLDAAGIRLRPKQNEILDVIAQAAPHYTLMSDYNEADDLAAIVLASRTANAAGDYPHDLALEQQIALGAEAVVKIMEFARTVVNPAVADIVSVAQNTLGASTEEALTPVDIVQDTYGAVWSSPALDSLVADYAGIPAKDLTFPKFLPVSTDASVYLKTGSELFDEDVIDSIKDKDDGFVTRVFNAYLSNSVSDVPDLVALNPFHGDRNTILVLFLLANHFNSTNEVGEGVATSLDAYRLYFANLKSELARRINVVNEQRERNRRVNSVVLSYPVESFDEARNSDVRPVIRVNGDTYGEWLAKGGDSEIILGAYVADGERNSERLIANAKRYQNAWQSADRVVKAEARNAVTTRTTNAIRFAVGSYIAEADADALPPVPKAELQRRLNTTIQDLPERSLGNLYQAVRTVACRTLYAHTDAERVLTLVDAQVAANPGIEIRDAALLAVIDYVFDYVVSWIDVDAS